MQYLRLEVLDKIKLKQADAKAILEEVHKEVLEALMEGLRYNQSKAAKALGISRTTLRTHLTTYFGNKYIGTRDDY